MLDLEPIRERREKATEGPWPDNGLDCWRWRGMPRSQLEDNRHFVAHARIDIPALIAEVERLRAALADKMDKQPLLFSRCASTREDCPDLCRRCSQQATCAAVGFGTVDCSGYVPD